MGIASADRFNDAPEGHRPQDILPKAKSVIVIAIRNLVDGLVLDWEKACRNSVVLPEMGRRHAASSIYLSTGYETVNAELGHIGFRLAIGLTDEGYNSVSLPPTYDAFVIMRHVDSKLTQHFAPFSHRHAGYLAGLGEIGINNLLITPQYGPRVRLSSILTTAELEPDPIFDGGLCLGEKCLLCVRNCPTGALSRDLCDLSVLTKTIKLAKIDKRRCVELGCEGPPCGGRCAGICPVKKKF